MQDNRAFGNQLRLTNSFSAAMVEQLYPATVTFEAISDAKAAELLESPFAFGIGHQATCDALEQLIPGVELPKVDPNNRVTNRLNSGDQALIHQLVNYTYVPGTTLSAEDLLELHAAGRAKFIIATAEAAHQPELTSAQPSALVSAFSAQMLPAAEGTVRFTRLTDKEASSLLTEEASNFMFESSTPIAAQRLGRPLPASNKETKASFKPGDCLLIFQRLSKRLNEGQMLTEQEVQESEMAFVLAEVL